MRILITGITGLLGTMLVKENKREHEIKGIYIGNYEVADTPGASFSVCDITDRERLLRTFGDEKIDCVIHAAGMAGVDMCQKNRRAARASNVTGTENVAFLAAEHGAKMVYISTNAIFDGTKPLYREGDRPNPINYYGKVKLECENLVRSFSDDWLIIRPILMYGWNRPEERDSVVTWMLKRLRNKQEIKLVDDIYDNPLYAVQCADCILELLKRKKSGVYHVAGKEVLNRYEIGLAVANIFGCDKGLIKAVKNSFFKDIAPRPKNTSYDTGKIERELGIKPMALAEGLKRMVEERNAYSEKAAI